MIDGDFGNVRRNYDCGNTDPELFEVKAVLVIERTGAKMRPLRTKTSQFSIGALSGEG